MKATLQKSSNLEETFKATVKAVPVHGLWCLAEEGDNGACFALARWRFPENKCPAEGTHIEVTYTRKKATSQDWKLSNVEIK